MGTAVFLPSPGRTDADPHGTNADAEVKAGCVAIVRACAVGEVVSRRIRRVRADSHTMGASSALVVLPKSLGKRYGRCGIT